ncbi:hypothetical protein PENSPDRAFT_631278 [Peniophora sp. CONT]|nr:hypothetical protein PENSPDRAFT_631278 [Peniophora sp. CONT]
MSDHGRMDITDKATAALKPDSEKSTTEHFGDKIKGKADNVGSSAQPQSEKSYTQQASDTVSGNSNHSTNESFLDKTKDKLGLGNKSS